MIDGIDRWDLEQFYTELCLLCPTNEIKRILNVVKNGTDKECLRLELFSLFSPIDYISVSEMYNLATRVLKNDIRSIIDQFCKEECALFEHELNVSTDKSALHIYPLSTLEDVEFLMLDCILPVDYKIRLLYHKIRNIDSNSISNLISETKQDTFSSLNVLSFSYGYVPNPNLFVDAERFKDYLHRVRRIQCSYLEYCLKSGVQVNEYIPMEFYI